MGAADRRRRALLRILVLSIVVAGLTTAQTADPDTVEMTAMKARVSRNDGLDGLRLGLAFFIIIFYPTRSHLLQLLSHPGAKVR